MAQVQRIPSFSKPPTAPADVPQSVLQKTQQKGVSFDLNSIIYGGFASAVYKGSVGGQEIAVKVLCSDILTKQRRFGEHEAEMIVRMQLKGVKGIVQTLMEPFLVMDKSFWYVYPMELGRENLASYLLNRNQDPTISEKKARRWFSQILEGLAYMHSKEMAHMKVSLWTIIIDARDKHRVFLVGLGQCQRKVKRVKLTDLPKSGYMAYWSPDMVPMVPHPDGMYDPYKADIWALGYSLFQSLAGESLWKADWPKEDLIMKGHHLISRKIENWNRHHKDFHPSDLAMTLLKDMMYYFEGARPTCKEVMAHKWWSSNSTHVDLRPKSQSSPKSGP